MYIGHSVKSYGTVPKQQYRNWLVETTKALTGWDAVPADLQYWTTQGIMTSSGKLLEGTEPVQLVEMGFIQPRQFHAVECNPTTHEANKAVLGSVYPRAHLYYGSLDIVMGQLARKQRFHPGVVVLDTVSEPNHATRLLAQVNHHALRKVDPSVMVVFLNVVLKDRYRKHSEQDLFRALWRLDAVHTMLVHEGWALHPHSYRYKGAAVRNIEMFTVCLHRGLTA